MNDVVRSNLKRIVEENDFRVFDLLTEIGLWSFYGEKVVTF